MFDLVADGPEQHLHYGEHPDQVMDVVGVSSENAHPVVLVHGGYWRPEFDRTYLRPLAQRLGSHARTYNVEYRRFPGHPDWQLGDVCAAIDFVARNDATPIVVGHSAGGHLSLLAAIHRPDIVHACLAIAPVTDLRAAEADDADDGAVPAFLGGSAEDHPHLDPARLPRPGVDYLVVHGTRDVRVPVSMSHDYADTVTQECGHFEWVDPRTAACASVIDQVLRWAEPRGPATR